MPRNIEIKARLQDVTKSEQILQSLCSKPAETLQQTDVFFASQLGRLKLRTTAPDHGALIFYQRPDRAGPKLSEYYISVTYEPEQLRSVLKQAHGELGVVTKQRRVYLLGRTRIHIDQVENLGDFIELEVVLSKDASIESAHKEALEIMQVLQIQDVDLIECAYFDLLYKHSTKELQ